MAWTIDQAREAKRRNETAFPAQTFVIIRKESGELQVRDSGHTGGHEILPACVACGEPTTGTARASLGGQSGVICDDCGYWCDGNVTE